MKKFLLSVTASALIAGCGLTQFYSTPAVIDKSQLVADINYLASDELQGRKTFSPGIEKAADYIASRFEQIGLEPLSQIGSYKQSFELFQISPESSEAVLNGKALDAGSYFVISSKKTLNWDQNSPLTVTKLGAEQDFRAAVNQANQVGGNHVIFADPAHQDMVQRYQAYFSQPQTRAKLKSGSLAVVTADLAAIESFNIKASMKVEKQPLDNVVGVLPGKSLAQEMVIFSGHFDHLGVRGEDIYNGADDNASGTSALLSLAQYFKALNNNERTLLFVGFTAEEMGLLGSANFANVVDADKIAAMVNIEMIGKASKFGPGRLWMTGADKSNMQSLLNQQLTAEQQIEANPYPNMNLFYRSDNASFARLGVPAHTFSSVQLDGDKHYHQASDEVSTLDLDSYFQTVQLLSKASEPLVTGAATPDRVDPLPARPEGKIY